MLTETEPVFFANCAAGMLRKHALAPSQSAGRCHVPPLAAAAALARALSRACFCFSSRACRAAARSASLTVRVAFRGVSESRGVIDSSECAGRGEPAEPAEPALARAWARSRCFSSRALRAAALASSLTVRRIGD